MKDRLQDISKLLMQNPDKEVAPLWRLYLTFFPSLFMTLAVPLGIFRLESIQDPPVPEMGMLVVTLIFGPLALVSLFHTVSYGRAIAQRWAAR